MNERGFTLLEVITAMVILGSALGLIITLFGSGLNSVRLTQKYSHALLFVQEKIDEELTAPTMDDEDDLTLPERGFALEKVTSPFLLNDREVPGISRTEMKIIWHAGDREKSITFYGLVIESEDETGV